MPTRHSVSSFSRTLTNPSAVNLRTSNFPHDRAWANSAGPDNSLLNWQNRANSAAGSACSGNRFLFRARRLSNDYIHAASCQAGSDAVKLSKFENAGLVTAKRWSGYGKQRCAVLETSCLRPKAGWQILNLCLVDRPKFVGETKFTPLQVTNDEDSNSYCLCSGRGVRRLFI